MQLTWSLAVGNPEELFAPRPGDLLVAVRENNSEGPKTDNRASYKNNAKRNCARDVWEDILKNKKQLYLWCNNLDS